MDASSAKRIAELDPPGQLGRPTVSPGVWETSDEDDDDEDDDDEPSGLTEVLGPRRGPQRFLGP